MLTSLALIFLVGLASAAICQRIKLPRIIGMLITGIVLGPYVLNALNPSILNISSELRQMALIIILIKAGLSLNISDLKKVGRPAILMSFLPACFEVITFVIFAPLVLKTTRLESAIIGAVLGAVSPAVVVPKMIHLMETKYGTNKSIPQLILAGASLDDVFVIVLFATFVSMAQGETASFMNFLNIPISIVLGIIVGALVGYLLAFFFNYTSCHNHSIRNSTKVIIVLGLSFSLVALEDSLKNIVSISGLLAIMSMSCILQIKCKPLVAKDLASKYGKLWIAAEIILFVLVGAAVDIRYTVGAGLGVIGMIFLALFFRSLGVMFCLIKTSLSFKEKIFCVISYIPKATVQAAIGSVPLALGLPCGKIVLSTAVLSIIITAPLGAFGIDATYKKLLNKENS